MEQGPCDDYISRQAVVDTTICEGVVACNECSFHTLLEDGTHVCLLYERVTKLPSVTPTQKIGRWIKIVTDIDFLGNETYHHRCSECSHTVFFGPEHYCPSCGAKMEGSEDKEWKN